MSVLNIINPESNYIVENHRGNILIYRVFGEKRTHDFSFSSKQEDIAKRPYSVFLEGTKSRSNDLQFESYEKFLYMLEILFKCKCKFYTSCSNDVRKPSVWRPVEISRISYDQLLNILKHK